jgi:hypothetical protein
VLVVGEILGGGELGVEGPLFGRRDGAEDQGFTTVCVRQQVVLFEELFVGETRHIGTSVTC